MEKFVDSEFKMAVDKIKGKQTAITHRHANIIKLLAYICGAIGQQEGAAAVNKTIVYGRRKIANIFAVTCNG